MKNGLALLCMMLLAACTKKMYTPNISNDSMTEEGTIRVQASGLGNNEKSAHNKSIENAFTTILFRGIPESVQSTPLIPDEAAARRQHADAMDCFKNPGCYEQFVTKAFERGYTKVKSESGGDTEARTDVTINMRALRSYLEKNNVIRKFGF